MLPSTFTNCAPSSLNGMKDTERRPKPSISTPPPSALAAAANRAAASGPQQHIALVDLEQRADRPRRRLRVELRGDEARELRVLERLRRAR